MFLVRRSPLLYSIGEFLQNPNKTILINYQEIHNFLQIEPCVFSTFEQPLFQEQNRGICGEMHKQFRVLDNRNPETEQRSWWLSHQHQMAQKLLALGLDRDTEIQGLANNCNVEKSFVEYLCCITRVYHIRNSCVYTDR